MADSMVNHCSFPTEPDKSSPPQDLYKPKALQSGRPRLLQLIHKEREQTASDNRGMLEELVKQHRGEKVLLKEDNEKLRTELSQWKERCNYEAKVNRELQSLWHREVEAVARLRNVEIENTKIKAQLHMMAMEGQGANGDVRHDARNCDKRYLDLCRRLATTEAFWEECKAAMLRSGYLYSKGELVPIGGGQDPMYGEDII